MIIKRNLVRPDTHGFGRVSEPRTEGCADAYRDETICERCKNYEIDKFGIPSCCGNEFEEAEDGSCES